VSHTKPPQQSVSAWQAPLLHPQLPFTQRPEQQPAAVVHIEPAPSSRHAELHF
jgi:hypothetical protein